MLKNIIIAILAFALIFVSLAYYQQISTIKIDPNGIGSFGTDLGADGHDIGYEWSFVPGGIKIGDKIQVLYRDNKNSFRSNCIFSEGVSGAGIVTIDGNPVTVLPSYYCEAPWPINLLTVGGGNRANYIFFKQLSFKEAFLAIFQ